MPTQLTAISATENIQHEEVFYQSAEFWVGVAFVLVVFLIFKPLVTAVKGMIFQRIERIKKEMQAAENIKLDAQKLYAEYEHRRLNAEKEVSKIIANEQAAIAEAKTRKMHEMNMLLKQKNTEADAKIEMATERVNNEINTLISEKTIKLIQNVFLKKVTQKEQSRLIDNSLKNLERLKIND